MDGRQREYLTLRKPHYLPANNCLLGFDSYNYFEGIPESYVKEFNEMIKRCYEELTDKHVVFVKNIDDYNL
jgi:hypothetical protein